MRERWERRARVAFWAALAISWAVAVWYMWEAMSTVPSAERLQESRLVAIPTPRTFMTAVVFSAMELAVVLAVLWPWRPAYYASRLALASLAVLTWFLMTVPTSMQLSRMDWVHRRWLAFLALAPLVGLLAVGTYRLFRAARKPVADRT